MNVVPDSELKRIWRKAKEKGVSHAWKDFNVFETWAKRSGYIEGVNNKLVLLNATKFHGPHNSDWRRQKPK